MKAALLFFEHPEKTKACLKHACVALPVCPQCAKIVQKLGFQVSFKKFEIQNLFCSCDVKFQIHLARLSSSKSMFCSYEPEISPGLIYRMKACAPVGVYVPRARQAMHVLFPPNSLHMG